MNAWSFASSPAKCNSNLWYFYDYKTTELILESFCKLIRYVRSVYLIEQKCIATYLIIVHMNQAFYLKATFSISKSAVQNT